MKNERTARRVHALLKRVGVQEQFVISGGIAKNAGVVKRLERRLGMDAQICFEPQIIGALGAAVLAKDLGTKRGKRRRKQLVDTTAATLLLRTWLERRARSGA